MRNLTPFRDAGIGPADFPITVQDVLRGLQIGMSHDWVTNSGFDELLQMESSWVVPGRILACASPSSTLSNQYPSKTPHEVLPVFQKHGIKAIIRLNESLYDRKVFED